MGGGTFDSETGGKYTDCDLCVYCGRDSGVKKETPVNRRAYYVLGSGQLCGKCYAEIYGLTGNSEENLTVEELKYLINMCKEE